MGTTEWRWLNTSTGPDVLCPSNASCQVLFLKDAKSAELQYVSLYLLFRRLTYIVYPSIISWLLVLLCCKFWKSYVCLNKDPSSQRPLPPGDLGLPFIGETLSFLFLGRKFFDRRREQYGSVFKTHILGKPTVRIIGAENARKILMNENSLVESQWPRSIQMLLGEGSLTLAAGKVHTIRKRAILRAFTYDALSGYAVLTQEIIRKYINKWCSQRNVMGYKEFRSLAFELSCRVLLGFEMNKDEHGRLLDAFETFMSSLFSIPIRIPGLGLDKGMKARETMLKKIKAIILQKQNGRSSAGSTDALSLMMGIEGKEKLEMEEAKDVALELMFAGHETTSSAASTLILNIARNPEVLFKITEELASNGLLDDRGSVLDLGRINKLKYVRNVVKEALRISPPIGGGYRKALHTFEIEGYQIPRGWSIVYSIRDSHETSPVVNKPEVFNPERWSGVQIDDREHYFPFGGGKKGCAGREFAMLMLKVFVIEICRSSCWEVQNLNPKIKFLPVPHPADNLPMVFQKLEGNRLRASTL